MKKPSKADAAKSGACRKCDRAGAKASKTKPGYLYCTGCGHAWQP